MAVRGVPVHFVHYVRNMKVNEKNARRDSGSSARSLRSLRFWGTSPVRARALLRGYTTLMERSERSEQEGGTRPSWPGFPVHCHRCYIVNGSERDGGINCNCRMATSTTAETPASS